MHDVFISHASDDTQRVEPLVSVLREVGIRVWWDGDLSPGERSIETIERALLDSRCTLVCWSHAALRCGRDWVRAEAEKAREKGQRVISVLLDEVAPPLPFNVIEAITLTRWSGQREHEGFARLVAAIRPRISHPPARKRKRALIVGVTSNKSGMRRLAAAEVNASEMHRMLSRSESGFECQLLIDPDAGELQRELERLCKEGEPESLLTFYYSGYVVLGEGNSLVLTASNSELDYSSTTLDLREVETKYLARGSAAKQLLVVDACYAKYLDRECSYHLTRADLLRAWKANLDTSSPKMLIASGACNSGPENWGESTDTLTKRLVRAFGQDSHRVDANHDKIIMVGELAQYLEAEPSPRESEEKPICLDLGASWDGVNISGTEPPPPMSGALTEAQRGFVDLLSREVRRGSIVPFLGDGIYGDGPLSFFCLAKELATRAGVRVDLNASVGIATAAEWLELAAEGRERFLEDFQEILTEQARRCEPPRALDFVQELKAPWFVVSVNYDDLLERRLTENHRSYVIVTHVLRSGAELENDTAAVREPPGRPLDGQMLLVRSKDHPSVLNGTRPEVEVCDSGEIALEPSDCVIYRLLGAPFLNELPFARELGLDTVVVTETDHIDFLTRLREPRTSVPRAFVAQAFREKKVLFLEYNLDIWHYRLVGHLFRWSGIGRADSAVALNKRPFVARSGLSPIEERFWERFNPQKTSIDTNQLLMALHSGRATS